MPGGYSLKTRDLPNPLSRTSESFPDGKVPSKLFRFGGAIPAASTDHRVHQETWSFRTTRNSEDLPDLTSGGEILRYFLRQGVPNDLDTGHDFWTTKSFREYSHSDVFLSSLSGTTTARGTIIPFGGPPIPTVSPLDVNFYGNRAISRVSPTSPNANLAQTSAEIIREKGIALPGTSLFLWLESRALFYRSLGKEYLNLSFGWVPFLNDMYKIVRQMLDITEEIQKYSAISQTSTVRRYDFQPIQNTTSNSNMASQALNIGPDSNIDNWYELYENGSTTGKFTNESSSFEKIYFKGRFMFKINPGNGLLEKLQAYEQFSNKLLGTRITPSVLWELTPWSWLTDWFIDVQSALQVAGMFQDDGLIMQYAYLMRETHRVNTYTFEGPSFVSGIRGPFHASSYLIKKERVRGTPFGFGVNPEGISPQKWAILAALAISKGPNRLPRLPQGEPTD